MLFVNGGWDGHEPFATASRFAALLELEGLSTLQADSTRVLADLDAADAPRLIVPNWTMGSLSEAEERGLLAAVRGGAGLAGWHGGMGDAFRANPAYQFAVGGQWVEHPGGIVDFDVQVTGVDHPITRGLSGFHVRSEQYYLHVDPGNLVLATTRVSHPEYPWVEGTVMPVAWARHYGVGRVAYCSLGHVNEDFDEPNTRELVLRGLLWAARADAALAGRVATP